MGKSYTSRLLSALSNYLVRRSCRQLLPMVLLLSGMSTVFLFDGDRRFLYRDIWTISRNENWLSSHHLSMAVNFSPSHHFLGFISRGFDAAGNIDYLAYNRFPPGGYALIKLVTMPFGDDLPNRIYSSRMLMLVFFVGAAVLAYFTLYRLTSNRWVASAVTLIAFSSTQFLRFKDTIDVEISPDLFGFILTFHGMVIFAQEGRLKQLAIKACLALLIGWHVLAVLLAFIFLGLVKDVVRIRKPKTVHELFATVCNSRYFMLGVVAFGFACLILAYNMGNEYYAFNVRGASQVALSELPSFRSVLRRTGFAQQSVNVEWGTFLESQVQRIGILSVPFALPGPTVSITDQILSNSDVSWIREITRTWELYIGIAVIGLCSIGMVLVRHRLLAATAVLSGFCWAIPMRNQTMTHPWEVIYYIGIPLFAYTLILFLLSKWLSEHLVPSISILGLWIFILSGYQISRNNFPIDNYIDYQKTVVDDFEVIRRFTDNKNIFVPIAEDYEAGAKVYERMVEFTGVRFGLHYYLSGRGIVFNNYDCDRGLDRVDFMVDTRREEAPGLLTPNNQMVFLYDRYAYEERIDEIVEKSRPVIRGDFDTYITDDRQLVYISDRCTDGNNKSLFLNFPISLTVYPINVGDIPDPDLGYEFNDFSYIDHFVMDTRRHVVIIDLPDYEVASIRTGQYADEGQIWGGKIFGPDYSSDDIDLDRRVARVTANKRPIPSDRFDIYWADKNGLIYVLEPCHDSDISDDFFVHVFPENIEDLPEHRRQHEFDNFDFAFVDHGTKVDQRCAAEIKLSDYAIARVRTGQYSGDTLIWQSEFGFANG